MGRPILALPAKGVWSGPWRAAAPEAMLEALPGQVRRIREFGAGAVEFLTEVVARDERYASPAVWREAATITRAEGLEATVHLPFAWVELTSLDRQVWEGSLRSVEETLRAVEPLAARMAVVHPANHGTQAVLAGTTAPARGEVLGALGERLVAALTRLGRAQGGGALALEYLDGIPGDLFALVVQAAGVGVCLDVGHALVGGLDPVELVGEFRGRLLGVHLHDAVATATGEGSAHRPLGTGRLDLEGLVAALCRLDFDVPVALEVSGTADDKERSARLFLDAVRRQRREGTSGHGRP